MPDNISPADVPQDDDAPPSGKPLRMDELADRFTSSIETLLDEVYRLDLHIEGLNRQLADAQPFGHTKIELRWWKSSNAKSSSVMIDPVLVRYVRSTNPKRQWHVLRLDRGRTAGAPVIAMLRPMDQGGWTTAKPYRGARKIAKELDVFLAHRNERVGIVRKMLQTLMPMAANARRRVAALPLPIIARQF